MICGMKFLPPLILGAVLSSGVLPAASLDVTGSESGKDLVLRRGDLLTVSLPSNRTTGYCWRPSFSKEGILAAKGAGAYLQDRPGRIGSGGTEKWTFRAMKPGTTMLTLFYARPWEKGAAPVKTVGWPVAVRP